MGTFLTEHNKIYEGAELIRRYNVFRKNMDAVLEHNSGDHSWFMTINQFSDLTAEEFESTMLGYIGSAKVNSSVSSGKHLADIDWRTKGALTAVKDQGRCGSCWAFSTTGGVEGSEFVDDGNQGCNGGLMDNAFRYIKAHGIPTESSYPYTGRNGACKSFPPATKISSFTDTRDLEGSLRKQPVSVAVDARKWS